MRTALETNQLKNIYGQIAHRYDFQHGLITARSDQRGRRMVVDHTVHAGDTVLDAGAGTGSTGILAAQKTGPAGSITFFDLSDEMLAVAKKKVDQEHPDGRIRFETGDMCQLPFPDHTFDVALSSYSLCPLYDPARGALEMYRVTKPGGLIGIAHSSEPTSPVLKWLADRVEDIAYGLPGR